MPEPVPLVIEVSVAGVAPKQIAWFVPIVPAVGTELTVT